MANLGVYYFFILYFCSRIDIMRFDKSLHDLSTLDKGVGRLCDSYLLLWRNCGESREEEALSKVKYHEVAIMFLIKCLCACGGKR